MRVTADDARFAVLALPYSMKDIAMPKEFIVNYTDGHLYVKSIDGLTEISITKTLETRIENILNQVNDSESIIVNVDGLEEDHLNPLLNEMKRYIDAIYQGISVKTPAKVIEAHNNIDISGIPEPIDGIEIQENDIVLLNAQTNEAMNGKWVVKTGAWERPADFDESSDFDNSAFVFIEQGEKYGDSGWIMVTDTKPIVVNTTPVKFERFTGAGQIIAGVGIEKEGNELRLAIVSGLEVGTYTKVTVDDYGRVVSGENPDTLAGYGIIDAAPIAHVGQTGNAHGNASSTDAGFMSANDFNKLQGINNVIEAAVEELELGINSKVGGEAVDITNIKVPKPVIDVLDTQDSTSTSDALSARQGNLIKQRLDTSVSNQNTNDVFDIKHWIGTQEEYDSLSDIDPNTIYYIRG